MPLDSEIPLSVRPPVFNSAFQNSAQLLALRGSMQEQQLRDAQIQNERELARERQRVNTSAISAEQAAQLTDAFRQHFADPQTGVIPEDKIGQFEGFLSQNGLGVHAKAGRDALIASNEAIQKHQQYLDDQKAQAFASVQDLPPDMQVTIVGNRLKSLGVPDADRFAAIAKFGDTLRPEQGKQAIQAGMATSPSVLKANQERLKTEAETSAANALASQRLAPKVAPPAQPTPQTFMIDGRPVRGSFLPDETGGKYLYNGQDVTAKAQPIPQRTPQAANDASQAQSDVKESVAGMLDGTVPPILPSRASKEYTALMAEAHRQKFDLVKANEDWSATQKYLSTLNGQQQVRLRQAVQFTSDSLPIIRGLAQEWDGGQFPILNKANLALAKNGAFGDKAASIAQRLTAQIADVTSELGTVYKGGNSSTDESLALAAKNLSGDWQKKVLMDSLDQVDQNLKIRKNSIKSGSPVANEGNIYANGLSSGNVLGAAPSSAPASVVPPAGAKILRFNPATGKWE